jgi:hypothetical protein
LSQTTISQAQKTIQLRNIRTQQQAILQEIARLAQNSVLDSHQNQKILKLLTQTVSRIEQLCAQQQLIPANLTGPSRQIYAWMKFLLDEHHLLLHVQATRRVQQLAAEVLVSSTTTLSRKPTHIGSKKINVEFLNMAGLYKYKSNSSRTQLQICEGFIAASDRVLAAVVQAVLIGKSSAISRVIRTFSLSEEFSEILLEMDLMVEAMTEKPQGRAYNLNTIFEVVNREYFVNQMPKPRLTWNQVFTRRKFAHYEPARDRIVVSRTLDNQHVPPYVVEFVLYHELLHKQHGQKWGKSRLMFHTPEFRKDERKFKQYEQAQQWLEKLATTKVSMKRIL